MRCLLYYASLFFLMQQAFASQTFARELPALSCKEQWLKAGLSQREYLYYPQKERVQRDRCYKEWLVLIYMNADNDLTEASYRDIAEMETVGSSVSVDLLVYHDSNEPTGSRYLHIAKTGMRRDADFKDFTDDQILSPVARWLEEQNSGDIEQFENFIGWGTQNYPAQRFAIIIWSHGMGWVARTGEMPLLDFNAADENAFFTIPNLHRSLQNIRQKYLPPDRHIDIFGADACLFMQFEVAFEVKEDARFLIGSASAESNHGWPYHTIMRYLVDHPFSVRAHEREGAGRDAAYHWARAIPEFYRSSYSGQGGASQGKDEQALMVSIHLDELSKTFPEPLNAFGAALTDYIQEDAQRRAQIGALTRKTYRFSETSHDLYHFTILINAYLKRHRHENFIRSEAARRLDEATTKLQQAIQSIVIASGVSPDYYDRLTSTKGISIWLPASKEAYEKHIMMFSQSRLFQMSPAWKGFIQLLHP